MGEVYMQIPMEQYIEIKRAQEEFERMKLSRNRWMEFNRKNTLKIHAIQEQLGRTELAETKGRMEIERLREALIDIVSESGYSSDTTGFHLHCIHEKARQALDGESK